MCFHFALIEAKSAVSGSSETEVEERQKGGRKGSYPQKIKIRSRENKPVIAAFLLPTRRLDLGRGGDTQAKSSRRRKGGRVIAEETSPGTGSAFQLQERSTNSAASVPSADL